MILEYRLWDKREKKMIYPDDAKNSKNLFAIGLHGLPIAVDRDSFKENEVIGWNVDHYLIPLPYTGLKSKNGQKVYEGDIVESPDHVGLKCIVKWCNGRHEFLGCQVGWHLDNGYYQLDFVAYLGANESGREEYANVDVLGNIYEHPELLKDMGSFGYDPLTGKQKGDA